MEYKPETKNCQNCKIDFIIESEDFLFYEKINVPAPTFCPDCRMQRRLCWRNEHNLHFATCQITNKKVITIYSPDKKIPIYNREYWWSDKWDQNNSGIEYDFSVSFFEQFKELMKIAPRPNLLQTNTSNGEYTNYILDSKNVYMVFSAVNDENTMYSIGSVVNTRDSVDIHLSSRIENSYWVVQCVQSSGLQFAWHCDSCFDCIFLIDCHSCSNCFCCIGLRNKSYCVFNQQYTKEEYKKIISEYNLGSYSSLQIIKEKFKEFTLKFPFRYARIFKSLDCTGDDIQNAKNCKKCFYLKNNVENCKYSYRLFDNIKDGMDLSLVWNNMEIEYECLSVTTGREVFFSSLCWNVQNVWYSDNCFNSRNLFGCIGLKNAQYCILNKQYTKDEYNELIPKIIEQMKNISYTDKKGREYRFGEFFPIELSPFSYNESLSQQYFTLSKDEILNNGFFYSSPEKRNYSITLTAEQIPDDIKNVNESIINETIECGHKSQCDDNCQTAFRIVTDELSFYKKHNLPLPRLCLNCRHQARVKERNPIKLWHRSCMKEGCTNTFETSYSPERPLIVYCEKCYQTEVI